MHPFLIKQSRGTLAKLRGSSAFCSANMAASSRRSSASRPGFALANTRAAAAGSAGAAAAPPFSVGPADAAMGGGQPACSRR